MNRNQQSVIEALKDCITGVVSQRKTPSLDLRKQATHRKPTSAEPQITTSDAGSNAPQRGVLWYINTQNRPEESQALQRHCEDL